MAPSSTISIVKSNSKHHIIAMDVGTTTIRACLFGANCELITYAENPISLEFSGGEGEGVRAEIDPDILWDQFCSVLKNIISIVEDVSTIRSLGISCQRNTFICWNRDTGEPCHKLVTWKDCRAREECDSWNSSWILKALNMFGGLLYFFTRQPRFKAARMFAFLSAMVTHRLMVTLAQSPEMQKLLKNGKLSFGCLDTWLIYKLTCGGVQVTEPSNASCTGLFDPYQMDWGYTVLSLISFPTCLLPEHVNSAGIPLALTDRRLFGISLNIGAVAGDQQSALFASGCWRKGDVNISMGTGSFLDVNTGDQPHASMRGLYPLVAWKFPDFHCFCAEGCSHDTALILKWAQSINLFKDVGETSAMASGAPHSDLCFVPAFGGLQTPINDYSACCAFLGLRPDTSKEQMVRSILESIAFRMFQIWNTVVKETDFPLSEIIRCCGGVSSNDFLCQTISTLINRPLQRIKEQSFASARGVAMMAGITAGIWKVDELYDMICIDKTFNPNSFERESLLKAFQKWERAIQRCLHFYE